jgi:hypothetical protein
LKKKIDEASGGGSKKVASDVVLLPLPLMDQYVKILKVVSLQELWFLSLFSLALDNLKVIVIVLLFVYYYLAFGCS